MTIDKKENYPSRLEPLLTILGNPQNSYKIIHIGGTNGKGSTSRFIYECLRDNNYSVGIFTSPFLEKFNERIEANGKLISDDDLGRIETLVFEQAKALGEDYFNGLSEFDLITAMAFVYYREQKVEFLVLEVGLGGRLDSTNVIKEPVISIITSISLDHTNLLGNTIEEIAFEKAGILKRRVPLVLGKNTAEAMQVIIGQAKKKDCKVLDTSLVQSKILDYTLDVFDFVVDFSSLGFREKLKFSLSMKGLYQKENAITAVVALLALREEKVIYFSNDSLIKSINRAVNKGRFEVLSLGEDFPKIILDGAHNPGGIESLVTTLDNTCKDKRLLFVMAVLRDKDVKSLVAPLLEKGDIIAMDVNNPRAMSKEELGEVVESLGGKKNIVTDLGDIILKAKGSYDVVVFCGSLYFIGKVRGSLGKELCNVH